jgi:hypothetical protein
MKEEITKFELPTIVVSDRLYTIAKIVTFITIFLVGVIAVIGLSYAEKDEYQFVECLHEPTNTINIYPEGTICGEFPEFEINEENSEKMTKKEKKAMKDD